jgi:hypothetical protein
MFIEQDARRMPMFVDLFILGCFHKILRFVVSFESRDDCLEDRRQPALDRFVIDGRRSRGFRRILDCRTQLTGCAHNFFASINGCL